NNLFDAISLWINLIKIEKKRNTRIGVLPLTYGAYEEIFRGKDEIIYINMPYQLFDITFPGKMRDKPIIKIEYYGTKINIFDKKYKPIASVWVIFDYPEE
ncbi:MAG: hypothetical protein ACP5JU_03800, partial [Minisyncoccia bacterium]